MKSERRRFPRRWVDSNVNINFRLQLNATILYHTAEVLMKEFSHLIFYLILQRPRGLKAMHDMDSDSE